MGERKHIMSLQAWSVLGIFMLTLGLIASGKTSRSVAALLGSALIMALHLLPSAVAVRFIDFNTIGLLIGMMIIVGVLSRTGIFQFVAVKTMKITRGSGLLTLIAIALVTAALSAFLDNVTTVLLISPVIISLADLMDMDPLPLLMAETMASNIGGAATLIGDPPNIIIGSYAGLSFMDFLVNLGPPALGVLLVVTVYLALYYRKDLTITEEQYEKILRVNEAKTIKDMTLLKQSGTIMGIILLGFLLHHVLHLDAAVIALLGAAVLLVVAKVDGPTVIHEDIEWPTLVFFACLFMIVVGLKETGVISQATQILATLLEGKPVLAMLSILWISGLLCAFINNVAFTATFVYVVQELSQVLTLNPEPLFWALALGACLGGNGSFLGSAANVVVADVAERSGHHMPFARFCKVGMTTVLLSLSLCSAYLYFRYTP
jgi:Na+/H+ antiporter NhaD/arsenite permease-like protein